MTPLTALRTLEIAAERIKEGPQTGQHVRDALNALRGHALRWKLDWLWEHLQTDVNASHSALIGCNQNTGAALRGIASDLGTETLDPVELAQAVRDSKTGGDGV